LIASSENVSLEDKLLLKQAAYLEITAIPVGNTENRTFERTKI